MYLLRCIECGEVYETDSLYTCAKCGGLLEVVVDLSNADFRLDGNNITLWKYRSLIPVKTDPVTLFEGGTPLYPLKTGKSSRVYIKHEGLNPSGSFKDRGMTVGITKALELKKRSVMCASTGNTSASMAMYAARASLKAYVILPSGKVALGKLTQAMMHGARVIAIKGNFDAALKIVRKLTERNEIYLLNSINPFRLEGQKTIAYEIVDQLGYVPDAVFVPIGNAGNISAIYKGFRELKEAGFIDDVPEMVGVQAEGADPVYRAFIQKKDRIDPVSNPETIATAIRIGNPVNAKKALRAIYDSGGRVLRVSDSEIVEAQKFLAKQGVGVEPASASSLAGFLKEEFDYDTVVCIATGNLLKDPEEIIRVCEKPMEVSANPEVIEKLL
ncbi:threonine synthase [Geoglobus acetivorans]|uniref:Threonine synthase n=1 Tax=Geoglobus acetivorans TaxID=565033 RepID=A0A0A7GBH9_GEOAI|nr:Threonine synthase [Geoglobus acetivorans]